jgi:lysozyme family protein
MIPIPAFVTAINFVLGAEGADSNDPHDSGGLTRFGIAQAHHPDIDVRTLDRIGAVNIYRREYWDKIRGDELPPAVALVVFDTAVNCGVEKASEILQVAVGGVIIDGIIGPKTLAAVARADSSLLERYLGARVVYYASLQTPRYFAGWVNRCFTVHRAALQIEVPRVA